LLGELVSRVFIVILQAARIAGFNVTYGDGSRASVIKAFGVQDVRAFVVVYTARRRSVAAVENLRAAFPDTPIWARALDLRCCSPT
jgi:voltage-gated potassium channel Kch